MNYQQMLYALHESEKSSVELRTLLGLPEKGFTRLQLKLIKQQEQKHALDKIFNHE